MRQPTRVLVIRRKAIGDILVSLPVLRAAVDAWPEAEVDVVVDDLGAEVVEEFEGLHGVLVYPARSLRQARGWKKISGLREWVARLRRRGYDLVVDLMATPQTAFWAKSTGASVRVGRARRGRAWVYTHRLPARGGGQFAGEDFLDHLRVLNLEAGPWAPVAAFPGLRWSGTSGRRILLNPSASWSAKAWPAQHFGELGMRLNAAGLRVSVAWGPGEDAVRDAVVEASQGTVIALGPTNLRELAAEICESALMITTDSGPKHLAVAQGVPTLTVFGSTDPQGWQPAGDRHRWLTHPVECHPCNLRDCPVPGHPCLDGLAAGRVADQARALLAELDSGGAP